MSPDEVLDKLKILGVNITRKTLLNYELIGLPEPERGSGGRGKGRFTEYPEETVCMAFAIYHMMNSEFYSAGIVKNIISAYEVFLENPITFHLLLPDENKNDKTITVFRNSVRDFLLIPLLYWHTYTLIGSEQIDHRQPTGIALFINSKNEIELRSRKIPDNEIDYKSSYGLFRHTLTDCSKGLKDDKDNTILIEQDIFLSKKFMASL